MADKGNWMKELAPKLKKGALREELHVKAGKNIPEKKLEKAAKSKDPTEKKRAVLALTFGKAKKKK